ncbi:MAG: helix-turn-helix transcriptional regulator, partial [Clostridia bacterium]|nr:helix-turn-helix transcriptional regulator [Clostridia bacterium]
VLFRSRVFESPVLSIPGAGEIFQEMRRCQGMDSGRSAYLSSRIWALIAKALEAGKKPLDYIDTALNYISTSYMQDISATALSQALNLDRSYFSTIFKERLGVSPGKYIQNYRLNKAVELMTVQGESISVAATSVGYLDICNFSKAFKQRYGMSPRAYLKTYEDGCR